MLSKVHGSSGKFSGSLLVDDADFSKSTLDVKIDMASITTADDKHDAHLKGAELFDVAKFPEMTFKGRHLEGTADRFKVVGDLTLHGVTKEVALEVRATALARTRRATSAAASAPRRASTGQTLAWFGARRSRPAALVSEKVELDLAISVEGEVVARADAA